LTWRVWSWMLGAMTFKYCPTFFRGYLAHLWCEKCQIREDVHVAAREMRMLDGGKTE
jgi:hypothetical protein